MKIDEGMGRRKGEWGGKGQRRNLKLPPTHLPSFTMARQFAPTAAGSSIL